jgi:ribosome maturation factor RimP
VLVRFEDRVAVIDVAGSEVEIPFADVLKAKTIYKFSRADFVSRGG